MSDLSNSEYNTTNIKISDSREIIVTWKHESINQAFKTINQKVIKYSRSFFRHKIIKLPPEFFLFHISQFFLKARR